MSREFRNSVLNSLAEFKTDASGGIAVLFGLSVFLLVGFAALAVDFARAQSSKQALQQDLDATLLYVGTEMTKQAEGRDPQELAQSYIEGLRRQKHIVGEVAVALTQPDDTSFQGTAIAKVPTTMMGILGMKTLDLKVTSEAQIGQQPVEFALVLDNTLSMQGNKLTTLKSAATSLIDTVYQAVNAEQFIKVSVVPFSEYVNVGMAHRNATWMSVPPNTTTTQNVCQTVQQPTEVPGSCRQVSYNYTQDGVPMTGTTTQCDYTYGPPVNQCSDVTTTTVWNGCAGSRNYPLNVRDQDYGTRVPGIMNAWCPTEITALTNQKDTAKSAIDAMVATGNTYIPAGLMWGWATLSKDAPYDEAQDTLNGKKVRKIMVLMTDGFNTLSPTMPYDGTHWWSDTAYSNQLTSELCTNIKAAKIELYTVAFEVTDATIKTILENCASDPGNFYDAADPQALESAFEKIAADFSPLRLTR
jgi:Flp pilus assembly protein TadG